MEKIANKQNLRSSNIELCRISAILMVLIWHSFHDFLFGANGIPFKDNVPIFFWESFAVIGVNVFVLITGYFSTTPKAKSLVNIIFICFFYFVIRIIVGVLTGSTMSIKEFFLYQVLIGLLSNILGLFY